MSKTNQPRVSMESVHLHNLFGFVNPIKGFEEAIQIPLETSPFVPDINPEYIFDPDMVGRVMRSYASRENMMFNGEKGTGKTTFVQQFCARLKIPLMSITGGPGLDEVYLMGSKTIENGSVKSVDGVLSYCLRHGINILIDEIAAIKPSVLVSINDVLNGDQVITLKHHGLDPAVTPDELAKADGSMTIKRHRRFRLFATDNTGGKMGRDPRFSGVNTQNSAVRSRFTCFKAAFMHPSFELKALIGSTNGALPRDIGKMMIELAIRIRASFELGEMSDTCSFRELQRWARKSLVYGDPHPTDVNLRIPNCDKAFVDAIYTGMEETDQDVARQFYELVFGSAIELPNEYALTAGTFLEELGDSTLNWDLAA
ncbi:AAA family ATPase [Pseudomonas syringae]|uniref:AAA family ATPase n=1 Tax=Pseudomonas syringae TaxID=317 RepID=UPI001F313C35|nr:AAA family ATPase [Pseudomonas syringae]